MLQSGLQLEQAPPIWVPFRFFLTAPLFVLLVAAALLWRGAEALEWRNSGAALAITHLYTLGFMSMVMMGAAMQMLPVLAGAPIPAVRTTAALTHVGLTIGALSLAAGFILGEPALIRTGAVALGVAFAVFIAAMVASLARGRVGNDTVRVMWLAAVSLLATAAFGVALAIGMGWGVAMPSVSLRDLHPVWGLLGWAGLLVIGVAYQVVPMFQMTPAYPHAMARYLGGAVFALLALWSATLWFGERIWAGSAIAIALALVLVAGFGLFAVVTLNLQRQRRRRLPDVTLDFWRVGMGSLIAGALLWAAVVVSPWPLPDSIEILIGLLVMVGFVGSVITGMLYKIMPFLVWFHLQSLTGAGRAAPNMKQVLPDAPQRLQFRSHVVTLALLLGAAAWPAVLTYLAAVAFAASALLLGANQIAVVKVFRENLKPGVLAPRSG